MGVQDDADFFGATMLDPVINCFLDDAIKMHRRRVIINTSGLRSLQFAGNSDMFGDAIRQFLERCLQAIRVYDNAAADFSGRIIGM